MLPQLYYDIWSVGMAHDMLPQLYYDNWSILCMLGTQYATLVVFIYWKRIVYVRFSK